MSSLRRGRRCQSSFFLLDTNRLRDNYERFSRAFSSRYEQVSVGYSYKTNYLPYACQCLHRLGALAEVVSRLEYDLALKLGVEPTAIIFNGPLKTAEDIWLALGWAAWSISTRFRRLPLCSPTRDSIPNRRFASACASISI